MSAAPFENPGAAALRDLLASADSIAVVGASSNPMRPSNGIMQKLLSVGYRVYPVNPAETEVLGQPAYASLGDVPLPCDIVNVFRRAEEAPALAERAVEIGARALWLQTGISSDEAAAVAHAGGLVVVMDLCIATMHALLRVPPRAEGGRAS